MQSEERKKIRLAYPFLVCKLNIILYRIKYYMLCLAHFQRPSLSLGTQVQAFPKLTSLLILIGSKMRSQSSFLYHHLPQTPLHPAQRIQILRPPSYTSPSRPKMPPSFTTSSVKASSNPLCRNDYVSALLGGEFVSNDMSRTEFLIVVQIHMDR